MNFAAGMSRHPDPAVAVAEVVGHVTESLAGPPSVAMLFVAGAMIDALDDIVDTVQTLLCPDVLVGSTPVGVVGGAEELEEGDVLGLWAAYDCPVNSLRLESLPGTPPLIAGLPDHIEAGSVIVAVVDPYTFPADALAAQIDEQHESVALVGGLAVPSGASDRSRIVLNDTIHLDGGAAFVLPPGVASPIVSQGCRPIGSPWAVTDADGQMIRGLGGRPALDRLNEVIEGLSPADRRAAANGLHVGVVVDEQQIDFDQGDFLIRAVLGADRSTGAVAVGDQVEVGQTLQFQVRDGASASEDLERLLAPVEGRSALLFTCNGRGSHMFDEASHDASRIHECVGGAVAGMFCAGELGPIGRRNAVHGFTATALLFH